MPVSTVLVQANALSTNENLSKDDDVKPFCTSTGWFSKFMNRYNCHNIKMSGEVVAAADNVVTEVFFFCL
jgi:hypothetical protein